MKKIYIITFLFLKFAITQAQISNPSFETSTDATKPNAHSQLGYISNWLNPTEGTPDYYGPSYKPLNLTSASNGSKFIGLYLELAISGNQNVQRKNYKEYATNVLSNNLIAGTTYNISFDIQRLNYTNETRGTDFTGYFKEFVESEKGFIGLCFSSIAPTSSNTSSVGIQDAEGTGGIMNTWNSNKRVLIPASNTNVYGSNSANVWTRVTLQYRADGTEKYMTLGQWREGPTSMTASGFGDAVYYMFDNFSMTAVSCNAGSTAPILH